MSRRNRVKREPEIVEEIRLLDMAYGGESVARLGETSLEEAGPDSQSPEVEPIPTVGKHEVVAFVSGAIPGEVADVKFYHHKKSFMRGNALKIIEPSPDRCEAPCPYFGVDVWPNCGGCQWQHIRYERQLEFKNKILRDQFERIGGISEPPLAEPTGAVSRWGYRNNVEFQVDRDTSQTCYHRQNSIRLVPVTSCHIAHPLITRAIVPLGEALGRHLPGIVHQVTVRVNNASTNSPDQPSLMLVLRMLGQWSNAELAPFAKELEQKLEAYTPISVIAEGKKRRLELICGKLYLQEYLNGVEYRVPPLGFFQSNSPMAEILAVLAIETFAGTGLDFEKARLLDLFCGVGTFTLQLAKRGAQALGVEEYAEAITTAQENARLNQLADKASFVAAKAEEYILELVDKGEKFDGVLLDPPRRGCELPLVQSLLKMRPPVLVYVSCDPSTLARDAKILSEGFQLVRSQVVDLFPQTYHMESVSLFRAKN